MARPRPARLLVVAGCVTALAVVAVLVRPGTAADEGAVARAQASLAPPSAPAAPAVPDLGPGDDLVVRAEGVDGLRLGMGADEVAAAGFSLPPRSYDGCRRVLPGLADTGPGPGVAGWLVDGEVVAVTVDARAGSGPSFLGAGLGDRLDDLPDGEGLVRASRSHPVPWQSAPVRVDVASFVPSPGRRASFVDLTGDGTIDHVQLRTDEGARCGRAYDEGTEADRAAVPVLRPDGWGEVSVGMPLAEAGERVDLQPTAAALGDRGRCRLVLGDGVPGLAYLLAGLTTSSGAREGTYVVRAVAVDAGATVTGLRVGDPAEQVQEHYPGVTSAFLLDRWDQGLVAEWQLPEGPLRLAPTRERVLVPDVDAVLTGPRNVVGTVQLGPGC
ncbi:hypothetical protein [Aquipuribacter sp. MA13-6]|uniref:hypothetical protein n=1 Tax=unclassified Aquipuribacter TaxID=2635084 RepID=UPI003EEB9526